jgi:glycosyltransferase involved in cell wall biosynthesis
MAVAASVPSVTVVIPAFNARAWIGETLSSVTGQTFPRHRLEIVVVDDGSSDGTAAEAAALLEGCGIAHTVLRNDAPAGPGAARNRGWRHGRGDWIQFLDADDVLDPEKVALQSSFVAGLRSEVGAVFSPWARLVAANGQWLPEDRVVDPAIGDDPVLDVLKADNFLQLGCLLFSRAWLERIGGFEERFRLIEDLDLVLRLLIAGAHLQRMPSPRPLCWYRQHAASLSRRDPEAFIDGCLRNARLAETHWRDQDALTNARAALLADVYFMGARFFADRDGAAFLSLVRDIYRLNPGFLPKAPGSLRLLTRLVGYPQAERCAVQYRRLKQTIRGNRLAAAQTLD